MAHIKILIKGYAKGLKNGGWKASSMTCLITTKDKKIISDPGCNREKLFEALKKEGLKTGDIDYVFLSHAHIDHILLAGLFENAKFVTYDTSLMYEGDTMTSFDNHIFGDEIKIIETPGHMLEHLSLVVDTDEGKVAIAGDVFFWKNGEKQELNIYEADYSQAKGMSMNDLIKSRKKLLALADYIIPGHGEMFQVEKEK